MLQTFLAATGFSTVSGQRPPTSRSNTPLFEALVCETHHAAMMTVMIASCVHGSEKGGRPLTRSVMDQYLPMEPAVLLSLSRRSLLEIEPLSETQDHIEAFFMSLSVLRRQLGDYFFEANEIGHERAQVLYARRLSTAASAACHEALRAVRSLEAETPGRLHDLYCDHAVALGKLLLAAERKEMPCLDDRGVPKLPSLPQRRRSVRRSLGQVCQLVSGHVNLLAYAKDISESGMGLLRVPFLHADDVVTVELNNGRCFKGRVVWCRDEAAGVLFDKPLPASDPLLTF